MIKWSRMPLPRKSADYVAHFRRVNEVTNTTSIAVTSAVDDVDKLEKIARWIDYRFSDEGTLLLNYGVEGETYDMVDGKPQYNEVMTNNPDKISLSDMTQIKTDGTFATVYDWTRSYSAYTEETLKPMTVWGVSASGDWCMPPVTLTTEEGVEYANIYGDIDTLIQESVGSFITGAKPMTEYDSFVEQIKSLNIARCIELEQAALDRYNNR